MSVPPTIETRARRPSRKSIVEIQGDRHSFVATCPSSNAISSSLRRAIGTRRERCGIVAGPSPAAWRPGPRRRSRRSARALAAGRGRPLPPERRLAHLAARARASLVARRSGDGLVRGALRSRRPGPTSPISAAASARCCSCWPGAFRPRAASASKRRQASAALARRSIAWNGAENRCRVLQRRSARLGAASATACAFDLVTGTPPYVPPGMGREPTRALQAPCHIEQRGGIEEYCLAAARLLAPAGCFVVCHAAPQRQRVAPGGDARRADDRGAHRRHPARRQVAALLRLRDAATTAAREHGAAAAGGARRARSVDSRFPHPARRNGDATWYLVIRVVAPRPRPRRRRRGALQGGQRWWRTYRNRCCSDRSCRRSERAQTPRALIRIPGRLRRIGIRAARFAANRRRALPGHDLKVAAGRRRLVERAEHGEQVEVEERHRCLRRR